MPMQGTKTILGGLIIVRAGHKGVQYMYAEDAPGDQPPLEKVGKFCCNNQLLVFQSHFASLAAGARSSAPKYVSKPCSRHFAAKTGVLHHAMQDK